MSGTQAQRGESKDSSTIISLRELNAKLTLEISKLRKKYAEVEAKKAELKIENDELRGRVAKLEQKSTLVPKEQSLSNINASCRMNSDDNRSEDVIASNALNSDTHHHIDTEPKSLENREIDNFLDMKRKEGISNTFRERNREKKLQCGSTIQDVSSDLSDDKDTIPSGSDQDSNLSCDPKTVNKIHDQNLDEFSSLSKPSINSDSADPFECNDDLSQLDGGNQYNQVTAQNIVCMFRKAIQSGQEEMLHWCHS